MNKKGFTLIEVVVAATIFALSSVVVSVAFVNTMRTQKRILLENNLFEDSRFVMERLINEIKDNTIDYEEYYNQLVLSQELGDIEYGENYGEYGEQFYNPGTDAVYGALCNDGETVVEHRGVPPVGCVVLQTSIDSNTGQNPYLPHPDDQEGDNAEYQETSSAFCDDDVLGAECNPLAVPAMYRQPRLYLINGDGTLKTMIVREQIGDSPDEYALAMIKLSGEDTADADSIAEKFSCTQDFDCTGGVEGEDDDGQYPLSDDWDEFLDGEMLGRDFTPISPQRVTIKELHFYVAPLDDPYKAFAERSEDVQMQPHVTIVMTIGLREEFASQVPGGQGFEITLQTTVSSGVYEEVVSY